jgi:DNA modification methylase
MEVKCLYDSLVPVSKLTPHPKNRNQHSKEQVERLAKILKYQGWRYPIKISNQTGFITSGHGRLYAAIENGWKEVPVNFQDYESDDQEYADLQADNSIASWAELDLSGINSDIGDLGPDFDIDLLGIKDFVLEPADKLEPQCDEDETPEHIEPKTKRGDIYKLGNHRLMCGDSTSLDDVEKLMAGDKADMVLTDPPYGIGFEYNQHKDTKGEQYTDFCSEWFNNLIIFSDFILVFTGWSYNGFWSSKEPKDTFYWLCRNKRNGGSISNFRKVEPIYIWGRPATKYDFDFFDVTTKIDPGLHGKHTCPKPVELIEQVIAGCKENGNVLDVFGGSGTTLIASEKTNRKCFMMEIDPHYCDVIVARWEKYTGKKAELITEETQEEEIVEQYPDVKETAAVAPIPIITEQKKTKKGFSKWLGLLLV